MTAWTPKAGEWAMVRVKHPILLGGGKYFSIASDRPSSELHISALHPLPPSLSAEDAAVLGAAADFIAGKRGSHHILEAAVRARAAKPQPAPPAPDIAALKEAVVEGFIKLLTPHGDLALGTSLYGPGYPAVKALNALNAALNPTPPDPVEELREILVKIRARCDRDHSGCNPQVLGDEVAGLVDHALAAMKEHGK